MTEPGAAARPAAQRWPLAEPAFRLLWLAWLTGNLAMWMQDVTAAWTMSQISPSPTMVALAR